MSASACRKPAPASPSPQMATNTSPATPLRKWSIDDTRASRLYSPASPALYGVDTLGAASPSPNGAYAFDDEHAYAYRYSLFDDYAESADDDLYPHALAPMPVASSSKLLLHQVSHPTAVSNSEPVQNFFDLDPESQIDQPYEYSYEYGVGLARRQFAEKRERRRGGVCEWDFALLDCEHEHGRDQDHLDAAVPDWSPLSDLSLASTSTDAGPVVGPDFRSPNSDTNHEFTDSTDNPNSNPNPSSPSYALRKARTAIGNTDAEEMARAMIGLGLVRPSYRPPSDVDVDELARESWRELGFGREEEGEDTGGSGSGSGWMWTTEEAPALLEGNMSFMDTEGTDADVVSHLDLDFDDDGDDEEEVEGDEHNGGGEGHGSVGAYTHTHTPADTEADTDDDHDHDHGAQANSTPFSVSPPPPLRAVQPSSQHLTVPTSTPLSQITLRGTRASALVDWAALALDAALREDPGGCWAAVCFGDVFPPYPPPPSRLAGAGGAGGNGGDGVDIGPRAGLELGTRGREREMLAFSHALASPELEVREIISATRAGDRPPEAEAEAEPETSTRRASEPDLRLELTASGSAQTTRGRSQRRKQLPPTSPAPPTQAQARTRPRIVTSNTTVAASPIPALIPAPAPAPAAPTSTSKPAAQTQARPRGRTRTRTRERTPVDPVLCATPATTPPSSALALVSVSPAGLGVEPGDVPPVPPLPPSASQLLPANPVVQDDEAQPSLAPLLEPAPVSSTGVPALRLDTSWSGHAPGSINSIPLPSMGRRVIGSEGDVFSHLSQSPLDHEVSADADTDAQEITLPTRNVHDDAIFAALLTPTAPLALSPTRPPAPRYRPLSDPPPYTAAVAGSNAPPLGLARGVSPGSGGSPGVDAEVSA